MTAQEVSIFLRLPMTTVYEMTSKGKLSGVKCGRQWRYQKADVLQYLNRGRPTAGDASSHEKRKFPRLKTCLSAKLAGLLSETKGLEYEGCIRNISEEGLLIDCAPFQLEPGDPVRISFALTDPIEIISVDARVVHQKMTSYQGIKLRNLSPRVRERIREYVG